MELWRRIRYGPRNHLNEAVGSCRVICYLRMEDSKSIAFDSCPMRPLKYTRTRSRRYTDFGITSIFGDCRILSDGEKLFLVEGLMIKP